MMNGMNIMKSLNSKKDAETKEWNMYRGTFAIRMADKWHISKVTAER